MLKANVRGSAANSKICRAFLFARKIHDSIPNERRTLLGVSAIGGAMIKANLIPQNLFRLNRDAFYHDIFNRAFALFRTNAGNYTNVVHSFDDFPKNRIAVIKT